MTSETTTLTHATSARDEWRSYIAFVKRPRLPDRASGISGAGLIATLRMLGLDLMVMLGLVLIAGAVLLLGFELPENKISELDWSLRNIGLVVIGAPLMEEIAFRGWLSGRLGHIGAVLLAPFAAFFLTTMLWFADYSFTALAPLVGLVALMGLLLFLLRRHGAMRWFTWAFPLFFWLSTLGFALVHLLNYTEGAWAVLLPLVIPQLVVGSILAYVRVHYGLWSSVLLHALHNGAAVGAVLLALELGA
jgi:membrane protease YdiL (CAAX protease family)